MEKRTVAIVVARGSISKSFKSNTPVRYKALLEINGRPMVDYVLRALQESDVEKVFVVQARDAGLDAVVTRSQKNVFLTCDQEPSSLALTLFFGLRKVMEYYGLDEFHRSNILMVPCDIPLAKKQNFNSLMEMNNRSNSDVASPIVDRRCLEEKYPQRHFRGLYLKDLNSTYTPQQIVFMNGNIFTFKESGNYEKRLAISDLSEDAPSELDRSVERLRRHRGKAYEWPHLIFELCLLLKRRRKKGHLFYSLKLVYDLCRRELTTAQIKHFIYVATGLRWDYLESKEVELSNDIDLPEDLESVLRIERGYG